MHNVCRMLAVQPMLHIRHWPTPCQCWHAPLSLKAISGQVASGHAASGNAMLCCAGNLHAMRNCIACSWDAHVSPQAWRLSPPLRHYLMSLPLPQCQEGPEVRPEQVRSSSNAGLTSPKQISTQALPLKPCSALTGSTPHILL